MSAPTLLVDGARRLVATNRSARRILERGELMTVDRDGLPRFTQGRVDRELALALAWVLEALNRDPGKNQATSFLVSGEKDQGRMMVHVMGLGGAGDHVVIMLPPLVANQDPERLRAVLAAIYGLTPAEARLGAAMLAGHTSGADLAEELGRSEWTIRSQIRALFNKLDVSTKTEAVNRMSLEVLPMAIDYCDFPRQRA
jgi:DNA-binding CsgD family transcriptional regulator